MSAGTGSTGARPPILHYSPELRPLLAVALGCHGNPDRCLAIGERRTPICARCVGFVLGNALGLAGLFLVGPPTPIWALAGLGLLLPVALDGSFQIATRYRSTNPRRLVTGALGGIGQIAILGTFLSWITAQVLPRIG